MAVKDYEPFENRTWGSTDNPNDRERERPCEGVEKLMKRWEKRRIARRVKLFIQSMPDQHVVDTPKDQIISEILAANGWFIKISQLMEIIREEVEEQFDLHIT